MLTLEKDSPEFETNANQTGVQKFRMLKHGVNPDGKGVYIYERTYLDGKLFGYEVFFAKVKKAGTYPLPNGKTISYAEDLEEYPGASTFGKTAWCPGTLERAMAKFQDIMSRGLEIPDVEEDEPTVPAESKSRGRPKAERPVLELPIFEFSVKEVAELNKVEYPVAFVFVKEQEAAGKIVATNKVRRAAKGKLTQLFAKVS